MRSPLDISVLNVGLTVDEAEKLRTRLNHDLLKNRLILGLYRLQSQVEKKVEPSTTLKKTVEDLFQVWVLAREDAVKLAEFFKGSAWLDAALELPFLRYLSADEKRTVADTLLGGKDSSNRRLDHADIIKKKILAFDKEMIALVGMVNSDKNLLPDTIEHIRTMMESLSSCIAIRPMEM